MADEFTAFVDLVLTNTRYNTRKESKGDSSDHERLTSNEIKMVSDVIELMCNCTSK